MVGTGNSSIRRLKRLARGESTAVVMGMAGGILLAAVMWRGSSSSSRQAVAASHGTATDSVPSAATPPQAAAARKETVVPVVDSELSETLAELEALPDASVEGDISDRGATPAPRTGSPAPQRQLPTPTASATPMGEATLACWNTINDIIAREAAMRIAPANLNAANASGFVEARVRAGRFAGESLRQLPQESVDRDVIAHAADLAAWYDEEARLAGEASSLLGSSDFAARRGAAGKSWRNAEDRHRQRCDEINQRSATLQTQLSHKYGRPFPRLQ